MTRFWLAVALAAAATALPARAGNRLINPDFDDADQISGWNEAGVWASADYASAAGSGSIQLNNDLAGSTTILARQCVAPVIPGSPFDASVYARAASGQSAGAVRFAVVFWDVADCIAVGDNDAVGYFSSPAAPKTGDWTPIELTSLVAPALTQAAEMQLIVSKDVAGGSLEAFFDHAYLPEPEAALSAAAAVAALAALAKRRS